MKKQLLLLAYFGSSIFSLSGAWSGKFLANVGCAARQLAKDFVPGVESYFAYSDTKKVEDIFLKIKELPYTNPSWAIDPFKKIGKTAVCFNYPNKNKELDECAEYTVFFGVFYLPQDRVMLLVNQQSVDTAEGKHFFFTPAVVDGAVLHEVGHIAHKHVLKEQFFKLYLKTQNLGVSLATLDCMSNLPLDNFAEMLTVGFVQIAICRGLLYTSKLAAAAYSRHQERQADAYVVSQGARREIEGMRDSFKVENDVQQRIHAQNCPFSCNFPYSQSLLSTHPTHMERIAFFEKALLDLDKREKAPFNNKK